MKEHFRASAPMRSTYPVYHLLSVWAMVIVSAALSEIGWWGGWMGNFAWGATIGLAMMLGQECYRYHRYREAKRTYEHYVEQNEERGM